MAITTLIFDWSGVISDDRRPVYEANMRLLERYGKIRMTFQEWLPKTTLTPREFLSNEGITVDPETLFKEFTALLHEIYEEGIIPEMYPDIPATLEALRKKGKRLFVVSSHPEATLQQEAKKYKLAEYFTHIQGNAKDKTIAMQELFARMGISPTKETTYTGDTIFDIQAAKKADVYSIGITTGYHTKDRLEKESPDKVIESFAEMLLIE